MATTVQYDPTGSSLANKIIDEIITPISEPDVFLEQGPFYAQGLIVTGVPAGGGSPQALQLYLDFSFSPLYVRASENTGKDVYSYLLLTNYLLWDSVTVTYQAVGGDSDTKLLQQIALAGAFDRTDINQWIAFDVNSDNLPEVYTDNNYKNSSIAFMFGNKINELASKLTNSNALMDFITTQFSPVTTAVATIQQQIIDIYGQLANVITSSTVASMISAAISSHAAAADPHPTYLTAAEANAAYDPINAASDAVAAHVAAADPHSQYLNATEGNALITAHKAESDPHPGYVTTAEGNALITTHEAAVNPHPTYLTQAEADVLYEDAGAVAAHAAAVNPHPTYLTQAEADALYDAIGAASSTMSTHTGAANPHPVYLTQAEADALYEDLGAVAAHAALPDPHPGYVTTAEGNALITAHKAEVDPHPGYVTTAEGAALITAHEAEANPHPVYLTEAEGDAMYSLLGHTHSQYPTSGWMIGFLRTESNTYHDVNTDVWTDVAGLSQAVVVSAAPVDIDIFSRISMSIDSCVFSTYFRLVINGGEHTNYVIDKATVEGNSSAHLGAECVLSRTLALAQNVTYTVKVQVRNSSSAPTQAARINASEDFPAAADPDMLSILGIKIFKS